MSLYEIDLNSNFKFNSQSPFLSEKDFSKFYKLNNLNKKNWTSQSKKYLDCLLDNSWLNVDKDFLITSNTSNWTEKFENLKKIISIDLLKAYEEHFDENFPNKKYTYLFGQNQNTKLYPNWQLFYIGLSKQSTDEYSKSKFKKELDNFWKISEIMYKEYLIKYSYDLVNNDELFDLLSVYRKNTFPDSSNLVSYLKCLLKLHFSFYENEQYKLMWNLESTYILCAISILMDTHSLTYTNIVAQVNKNRYGNRQTDLNDIYIDLPTYLKGNKQKNMYLNPSIVQIFSNVFNENINQDILIEILHRKEKNLEVLNSIVELTERFYANKRSESTVLSITIGLVLSIEVFIKEKSKSEENYLFSHIENVLNDSNQKLLKQYHKFPKNATGDEFFNAYSKLIDKPDSLEKYFMLYKHARNYLAHSKIEFDRFFYENNHRIIGNVINSILIVLYYLEKKKPQ